MRLSENKNGTNSNKKSLSHLVPERRRISNPTIHEDLLLIENFEKGFIQKVA